MLCLNHPVPALTIINIPDGVNEFYETQHQQSLIFQGGGSLGAYEAGAYKAINEDLSAYFRTEGRENEPIFHIVSGTSIGAINARFIGKLCKGK